MALKALLLAESGIESPASRCRVIQYVPHLAEHGIDAEVVSGVPSWRDVWSKAATADVVMIQRRALSAAKLLALRARARRIVFDFDDAIWLKRDRSDRVVPVRMARGWRLRRTARIADAVIAGNEFLAGWSRRTAPAVPVTVLATPVDLAYYAHGARPADGRVILGWVGARDNLRYLDSIAPALAALAKRHPEIVVRVVCNAEWSAPGVPVENVRWTLDGEATSFAAVDIGLMPLADDEWTRGKCSYKAIQFMAAGRPVVCSPVGMNKDVVTGGSTGLFASTPEEWERELETLIASPEARALMGAAARENVGRFDLRACAKTLAAVLAGR